MFLVPAALAFGTPHGIQPEGAIEIVIDTAEYPGLTRGYALEATEAAAEEWMSAPCGAVEIAVTVDAERARVSAGDGVNSILFASEGGAGGAAYSGESVPREGGDVPVLLDYDSVISPDTPWVSDADISAWDCEVGMSLQGWLTHEIGHVLGLTHTCEEGEECASRELQEATMYWAMAACDLEFSFTNPDDEAAIAWLYGPSAPTPCGETDTSPEEEDPPEEEPAEEDTRGGCAGGAGFLFVPLAWRRRFKAARPAPGSPPVR